MLLLERCLNGQRKKGLTVKNVGHGAILVLFMPAAGKPSSHSVFDQLPLC